VLVVGVVALAQAVVVLALGTQEAGAAGACLGSKGHYFAGWIINHRDGSGDTYEGAQAHIQNNTGSFCTNGATDSSHFCADWVMVSGGGCCGNNDGWAQAGFNRNYGGCTTYFSQWRVDTSHVPHSVFQGTCRTGGATFEVVFLLTLGDLAMEAGGTILSQTNFNPYQQWTEPFLLQFNAESAYVGDNIPGTPSAHTAMTSMQLQRGDGTWTGSTNITGAVSSCPWPFRYDTTFISSRSFDFWTNTSSTDPSLVC
jgi:hypothetical protein